MPKKNISAIFKVPMEPFFQLQFFIGYFTLPLISAYDYLLYTLRSAFPEQLSCDRIAFPVTQKPSQAYIMLETVIKVLYYRGTTQIDLRPLSHVLTYAPD